MLIQFTHPESHSWNCLKKTNEYKKKFFLIAYSLKILSKTTNQSTMHQWLYSTDVQSTKIVIVVFFLLSNREVNNTQSETVLREERSNESETWKQNTENVKWFFFLIWNFHKHILQTSFLFADTRKHKSVLQKTWRMCMWCAHPTVNARDHEMLNDVEIKLICSEQRTWIWPENELNPFRLPSSPWTANQPFNPPKRTRRERLFKIN